MRYGLLVSIALVLSSAACSRNAVISVSEPPRSKALAPASELAAAEETPAPPERKVGDFWVHRISGTFSKRPMLLVERVLAKDENGMAIEYTLEDEQGTSQLVVHRDAESGVIVGVSRVVNGNQEPGSIADYEALMAKTTIVPDSNEGYVDRTLGTCLVGPSELDCETKSYRVRIGEREASLDVTRSQKYPDRDIGGEITTADGEVIYRSELLEAGHSGSSEPSVAAR